MLRPRVVAIASMNAAVNFSAFSEPTSWRWSSPSRVPPLPVGPTGDAAPMLVPGAIAAMCAAIVMNAPAEAAHAPWGDT
jgi:hypothetical protein